jgi:hypothetical protein
MKEKKESIRDIITRKLSNKKVIKESPRMTVDLSKTEFEPTEDRSRFFKDTYKEEKRRLFFK